MTLLERHRKVLPRWLSLYYEDPIQLVDGRGCCVRDAQGREYLDFFGGILTTMAGYNVPEIVEAIQRQAEHMVHSSTLYLIEPMIELAELIASKAPMPNAKVFFTASGSEANDTALMLATTVRRSNQVLALRNSYHGRSFAAQAVTGNSGWSASSLTPLNVSYVQSGYKYRSPFKHLGDDDYATACAADLRDVLLTCTSGDVAAMIAEPVQGVGGFIVPPPNYFRALKEVLDENGILFISDEVQTGWGRTGDAFWGCQAYGVEPDIATFAKGVANGVTMGGVIARAEIMDAVQANSISTFGGNPLSTAAGLATLRYTLDNDLQANAKQVGAHMLERLSSLAGRHACVGEVRGKGLMLAVEFVEPDGKPAAAKTLAIHEATKRHGLLVGKGGMFGNCFRIAPPLCVSIEEADRACDILETSIAESSSPSAEGEAR
ncbi:MAG TPA: aspartate aminotransferase family protein [Chloroflexota bacterium]|nr:aspartate aminotransferase family protein [Chloroflexota bacterium]